MDNTPAASSSIHGYAVPCGQQEAGAPTAHHGAAMRVLAAGAVHEALSVPSKVRLSKCSTDGTCNAGRLAHVRLQLPQVSLKAKPTDGLSACAPQPLP